MKMLQLTDLNSGLIDSDEVKSTPKVEKTFNPKWLINIDDWNRDDFLADANSYLLNKNGAIGVGEMHLLGILVTQLEIYIECINGVQVDGLIISFNNGVTLGPNPHLTVADKALNRIVQLMKELELSPKARDGYRLHDGYSPEFREWLKGP